MKNTFSVVIPTKNRPKELAKVVDSILTQTCLPEQLIIIDQSSQDNVFSEKLSKPAAKKNVTLDYIHDETISGLVQAKAVSLKYNCCDYISFFDDDIVLEKNYIENINYIIKKNPYIMGLNGKILNYPKVSLFKSFIYRVAHIGLFKDNRISSQLKSSNICGLIQLNVLSGGLSTWNKSVFDKVQFDLYNNFHAYEDQEFSIRVKKYLSNEFYLVPNAKLYHNHSSINRSSLIKKYKGDILEVFLIYKKNKDVKMAKISLVVLLIGLFFNAIVLSISLKNIRVLNYFFKGFLNGIKSQPRYE